MSNLIHKLHITAEAAFDIKETLGLPCLDRRELKAQVEEYITHFETAERLPWWGYFRCDYLCEDSGQKLKLFLYRRQRFLNMQHWDLAGVCLADDWDEEAEDDGVIRAWLNTKIDNLPDEDDWVVRVRVWQIINETNKTVYENVLEEVKSEFEHCRDKKTAEKLAFLQSVFFSFRGRRRTAKTTRRD